MDPPFCIITAEKYMMAKFSRSWTQYMKADKQGFKDAFEKVVRANKIFWSASNTLFFEVGEDCKGQVNDGSFFIYRRRYNKGRITVDGTIQENENGITLVLKMYSFVNSFLVALVAFFLSVIAWVNFLELLGVLWLVIFCLPVYALFYWLVDKFVQWKLNSMQRYYIKVLNEIEKHVMARG